MTKALDGRRLIFCHATTNQKHAGVTEGGWDRPHDRARTLGECDGNNEGNKDDNKEYGKDGNIPDDYDALVPCNSRVRITYDTQAIPSTYGMPTYEIMNVSDPLSYTFDQNEINANDIDVTGKRVESYYEMAMAAAIVTKFQRLIPRSDFECFSFMDRKAVVAIQKLQIASKLKRNKYDEFNGTGKSFNTYMSLFQTIATKQWRGTMPKTAMIIPPISPEDKKTNKGAGKVILSLLALFGILEATKVQLET